MTKLELKVKKCSKCKKEKPLDDFYKDTRYNDGKYPSCKSCIKLMKANYYNENKVIISKREKIWYKNNIETISIKKKKYNDKNKIKKAIYEKKYLHKNKNKKVAMNAKYRAKKLKATPSWLTEIQLEEVKEIYKSCPKGYHVDHIVPLQGKTVCGLHVPWNLQILTAEENLKKGNKI